MNYNFREFAELGLTTDDTLVLISILEKIELDDNYEEELEQLLCDPFAFEGGGLSLKELILMVVKQIKNN